MNLSNVNKFDSYFALTYGQYSDSKQLSYFIWTIEFILDSYSNESLISLASSYLYSY